ncbi:hypothetical protein O3P69_007494 [Scylla paramamosain]|uniref:Uncharacterized protein n=1 Tax=Scylla paramamosain TaxID=85552 RepID=A0AAW0V441_SCYPA
MWCGVKRGDVVFRGVYNEALHEVYSDTPHHGRSVTPLLSPLRVYRPCRRRRRHHHHSSYPSITITVALPGRAGCGSPPRTASPPMTPGRGQGGTGQPEPRQLRQPEGPGLSPNTSQPHAALLSCLGRQSVSVSHQLTEGALPVCWVASTVDIVATATQSKQTCVTQPARVHAGPRNAHIPGASSCTNNL